MLSNIYFLPLNSNRHWLVITAAGLIALLVVVTTGGVAVIIRRWWIAVPLPSPAVSRVRVLAGVLLFAWMLTVVSAALFLPGGPLFGSTDRGIERLAMRLHDAGISVQTTLVAYDAIGGPGRLRLVRDRVMLDRTCGSGTISTALNAEVELGART
jgi:hypothetical protein